MSSSFVILVGAVVIGGIVVIDLLAERLFALTTQTVPFVGSLGVFGFRFAVFSLLTLAGGVVVWRRLSTLSATGRRG
ncbi:MAG: hypothetical protein ABEI99_03505, partial [Halobaculum sp.]